MRYIISLLIAVLSITSSAVGSQLESTKQIIDASRQNSVRVTALDMNSTGTGFFIDETHIVTCFHVISLIEFNQATNNVKWAVSKKITVTLNDGETIPATCVSIPNANDVNPLVNDFAILRLTKKPKSLRRGLPLLKIGGVPEIGALVIFSGYPLGAPTLLTTQGLVSGVTDDQSIICIQAPINKGNSGGALINEKGEVIAVISNREGGISQSLDEVSRRIQALESGQSGVKVNISMGGVNTLGVTKDLIGTESPPVS